MNLYHISQVVNDNYDTYDSAVVAAETEESARMTHPSPSKVPWNGKEGRYSDWTYAAAVKVKLIGTAIDGTPAGVICASFNAG